MADALELTDDDFHVAPDAPPGYWSKAGQTQLFTVLFISAAILGFIQLIVPQFLVPMLLPSSTPSLFSLKVETVQANHAVWWQDQLWVSVMTVGPGTPPRTSLRAFKSDGTWDRPSDLIIPVPFETLIADGKRLFLVSSANVSTIEDRLVRTTYPKVKLNQPSQPFVSNGTLSILDHAAGQPDVIWYDYREGEWIERGRLDLPVEYQAALAAAKTAMGGPTRAVRVRLGGGVVTPFVTGNQNDGLFVVPLPDGRVWVAMADFNNPTPQRSAKIWSAIDPSLLTGATPTANDRPADALQLNDPAAASQWTVQIGEFGAPVACVLFDDEPAFVVLDYGTSVFGNSGSSLQLFTRTNDSFVMKERLAAFPADTPAPLVKPDGTLEFVAPSPIAPMSLNTVELTKDGFGPIKRVGEASFLDTSKPNFWPIYALISVIPLSTTLLLGVIAHVLVQRHRDRRYSFGHHTVKLASIARRGAARGIDVILFGAPMWIVMGVLWAMGDVMALIEGQINSGAIQTLVIWALGLALGMLFYVIVAVVFFGTMEGLWGCSPGKWLFNIRVIRTTFQPIGFFRGMIRQFLLIIDGMFNYFVAIVMASCLAKSQRLGDMCADSIVVEKASLPPNWPRHRQTPPA